MSFVSISFTRSRPSTVVRRFTLQYRAILSARAISLKSGVQAHAKGYPATALAPRSRNWVFDPGPRAPAHPPLRPTSACSMSYRAPAPPVRGHRICSAGAGLYASPFEEVSVRVKKTKKAPRAKRAARSIRSKKAAVAAASTDFAWTTSARAIVVGMIFVVVVAALLTAREDAPRADIALAELAPDTTPAGERDIPRAPESTKTVVAKPATTPAPEPSPASSAASTDEPIEPAEPKPETVAAVTIAGCLENEAGSYRLTDASGVDAPVSRSWKSGFLKKRPAPIELADAVGTLNLRSHVGRRVAATGTLVDREMRARSVRTVGMCA